VAKIMIVKIDRRWFARAIGFGVVAAALFLVGSNLINHYIAGGVILSAYVVLVLNLFLTREDKDTFRSLAGALVSRKRI